MSTLFQTLPDGLPPSMLDTSAQQTGLAFPESLTEKYRPKRIADFIGISKPRKVLSNLLRSPRSASLIFKGEPGTGKTTLALAFCEELGAELHHIPSAECRLEVLQNIISQCHRVAFNFTTGKPARFHVVLCDEADCMSDASQKFLLSKMDSTAAPPDTIFIFTCNSTERLEERFLSRCIKLEFTSYGSGDEVVQLLERIWKEQAPADAEVPNLRRLGCGNIREAINRLELEILSA